MENKNKYKYKYSIFLLVVILLLNCNSAESQVRRIDLYVIPLSTQTNIGINYNEVEKMSTIKITIKCWPQANRIVNQTEILLESINNLKNDSIVDQEGLDCRVKCVVRKWFGRKEVLYFDRWGYFFYKGKIYKHEKIKSLVFRHIPCY